MKNELFSPVVTAEFSKFADILSAALSQHHHLGFEIAQLECHHLFYHFQFTLTHGPLNAEFQRIAHRDKKAFLSDQCKEIEENNRMGKSRDLFKKIRDTKGILYAKMGTIKDRDCMELTEAEDIKRWQEYTEELY